MTAYDYRVNGLPSPSPDNQFHVVLNNLDSQLYANWNGSAWARIGSHTPKVITANYTVLSTDTGLLIDAASQSITLTLPPATSLGQQLWMKRVDNVVLNTVTITRAGLDTIEASVTMSLPAQFSATILVSDGVSKWLKMSII